MLRIPIPAFYLDENKDGIRTVIDGQQQLTTINRFMSNELKLCNLQYLIQYNGKTYQELEYKYQQVIEDSQLTVNILDSKHKKYLKFNFKLDDGRTEKIECQPHIKVGKPNSNLRIYFCWCDSRIGKGKKILIGRIGRHPY